MAPLLLIIILGVILVFAFLKGRKNPKIAAFIFFGMTLISLIVFFKFKEWVWQNSDDSNAGDREAREIISIGEPVILILICVFLILGGYFLYKSTTKKG